MSGPSYLPEPSGGDAEGTYDHPGRLDDRPHGGLRHGLGDGLDGGLDGGDGDGSYHGLYDGFRDGGFYDGLRDGPDDPGPSAMDRIRRSAPGTMLAAAMLGLGQIIEGRPPREEITIVSEAPGEPFRRVELRLDPVHKERSLVIVHAGPPGAPPATSSGHA